MRPPHADQDILSWGTEKLAGKFEVWYSLDAADALELAVITLRAIARRNARIERMLRRKRLRRAAAAPWVSIRKRRMLYGRDEGCCAMCGRFLEFEDMTIGHIIAVSRGGGSGWDNVQVECKTCNNAKGSRFRPRREGASPRPLVPYPAFPATAQFPQSPGLPLVLLYGPDAL
jgi:HNH endonuclease